jgi:hypothetical protein
LKEKQKMPHRTVEPNSRFLIAQIMQIVMVITVAIAFLMKPMGQSMTSLEQFNTKSARSHSSIVSFDRSIT